VRRCDRAAHAAGVGDAKDVAQCGIVNLLAHFARKLTTTQPITIVAVGSSSTEGAGASSKTANYPTRLEAKLRKRFPGHPITVLSRGIGG
jgi:hypothetical protein